MPRVTDAAPRIIAALHCAPGPENFNRAGMRKMTRSRARPTIRGVEKSSWNSLETIRIKVASKATVTKITECFAV